MAMRDERWGEQGRRAQGGLGRDQGEWSREYEPRRGDWASRDYGRGTETEWPPGQGRGSQYGRDLGYDEYGRDYSYGDYGRGDYGRGGDFGRQLGRDYQGQGSRGGYGGGYGGGGGYGEERGAFERIGDAAKEGWRRMTGKGPKGYTRSDDRIREDVCDRLAGSWMNSEDVEVQVKAGEVTLMGTVRSRDEKRAIADIAEDVSGVRDVHNQIKVRPESQAQQGDPARKQEVRA